jgi:hypothetical protein
MKIVISNFEPSMRYETKFVLQLILLPVHVAICFLKVMKSVLGV